MKLGVVEYFDAAHYLPEHRSCGVMHGHTYKVEVILEGEPRGGIIVDFADVKATLREVLAEYDHRMLNELLPYPSAENICMSIYEKLKARLNFPLRVRLWEGEGKWVETGD
ncbi:6-pyruvoyl trahydropterin synthase family protein [Candidatus Pyrohabitans sp.]